MARPQPPAGAECPGCQETAMFAIGDTAFCAEGECEVLSWDMTVPAGEQCWVPVPIPVREEP